jgi:carbonic anhydrase
MHQKLEVYMKSLSRSIVAVLLLTSSIALPAQLSTVVSADEALMRLKSGNQRFVSGKLGKRDYAQARKQLAGGQSPYAIILTCSDSRVAPEIVFDESLGKLFTVRVAGNVVDPVVLGSIEYAVEHLNSRLVLVMGHQSCGAVKAAIAGGHTTANIEELLHRIEPAAQLAKAKKLDEQGMLKAAIEANVRLQMERATRDSELLREFAEKKGLKIVGGVYSLQTGRVEFLSGAS